jgi:hypothetical protein
MTTDCLERLAEDWPDWSFHKSRNDRYWIATYRWAIPVKILLSATPRPAPTVIADSVQELADKLSAQPRGIGRE